MQKCPKAKALVFLKVVKGDRLTGPFLGLQGDLASHTLTMSFNSAIGWHLQGTLLFWQLLKFYLNLSFTN